MKSEHILQNVLAFFYKVYTKQGKKKKLKYGWWRLEDKIEGLNNQ